MEESERGSGFAGPSESARAERLSASERSEPTDIDETRERDDPARLADEARAQAERHAAELRAAKVPIETEPAATYRP